MGRYWVRMLVVLLWVNLLLISPSPLVRGNEKDYGNGVVPSYHTDFSLDVSSDWVLVGPTIHVGTGMDFSGGWGKVRWAQLDLGIPLVDVALWAEVTGIGTGNPNAFVEIGARTQDVHQEGERTSGVYLRVYGAGGPNARIALYDAGKLIAEKDSTLFSRDAVFTMTLILQGNTARAIVVDQNASDSRWELTGIVTRAFEPGSVRLQGCAYTGGPVIAQFKLLPDPTEFPKVEGELVPAVYGPYVSAIDTERPIIVAHTDKPCTLDFFLIVDSQKVYQASSVGQHHYFPVPDAVWMVPGTYQYTLRIGETEVGTYQFLVPEKQQDTFAFAVVGDAQNAYSPERRAKVMGALADFDPQFILHTGDLHAGVGDGWDLFGRDWWLNFFAPMSSYQAAVPFYPVLGNHDDELVGQRESFIQAFPQLPMAGCYSFKFGQAAFFFLDIQNQIREFFDKGHDQWLRAEVGKYPDVLWRIVVFHVPPWSGGHRGENQWTVGRREELLEILQELDVHLVFCGHDHNYQRSRPLSLADSPYRPVQFVTTGLSGANYYDAQPREYLARVVNRQDHFCLVEVAREEIRVRVVTPAGEEIDFFQVEQDTVDDVYFVEP